MNVYFYFNFVQRPTYITKIDKLWTSKHLFRTSRRHSERMPNYLLYFGSMKLRKECNLLEMSVG